MSGVLWALGAGVGFGLSQALNRWAVRRMDAYVGAFIQILGSAVVLLLVAALTEDWQRLRLASPWAWFHFSLAGLFHFFGGWTFLNISQKQIGAARTGALTGTVPIFAAALAALTLQEVPTLVMLAGIVIIVGGVYWVNEGGLHQAGPTTGWRSLWSGLATALCWAISPIFIRYGLAHLPSPLLGLTLGIWVCVAAYAVMLWLRHRVQPLAPVAAADFIFKAIPGITVGLATWARWVAIDLTTIAVVLALNLVSVPIVNWLSPLLMGTEVEQVTPQVWWGSALIIGGTLLLILFQ